MDRIWSAVQDLIKDRPTVTIPDDHDVGQATYGAKVELWLLRLREIVADSSTPIPYVNMVQRQQTWHLPDPVDPKKREGWKYILPDSRVGGIDFAILEDRKFKAGPAWKDSQNGSPP